MSRPIETRRESDLPTIEEQILKMGGAFLAHFTARDYKQRTGSLVNPYHQHSGEPYFTADQISTWRPEVASILGVDSDPATTHTAKDIRQGVCAIQQCLRTQRLIDYQNRRGRDVPYGTCFRMASVLTTRDEVVGDMWDFFTKNLNVGAGDMRLKVSSRDTDLIDRALDVGIPRECIFIMDESLDPRSEKEKHPSYFEWKYGNAHGMHGVYGRGATFAVLHPDSHEWTDVGNLIALKSREHGEIKLWDAGFGLETLIRTLRGDVHAAQASEMWPLVRIATSNIAGIDQWEKFLLTDVLVSLARMHQSGIRESQNDRGGKIWRSFLDVAMQQLQLCGVSPDTANEVIAQYLQRVHRTDSILHENLTHEHNRAFTGNIFSDKDETGSVPASFAEYLRFEFGDEAVQRYASGLLGMTDKPQKGIPLAEVIKIYPSQGGVVTTHGRITAVRGMGKILFLDIHMDGCNMQVALRRDDFEDEVWFRMRRAAQDSNIVEVSGTLGFTKTGQPTIFATDMSLLTHALLADGRPKRTRSAQLQEEHDLRERSAAFYEHLREFHRAQGYHEVQTEILQASGGGANARPFRTFVHATKRPVVLRIAPELSLKMAMVDGNLSRVFELGPQFRNEGIDRKHYPEFTSLEAYCAFTNLKDRVSHMQDMVTTSVASANLGSTRCEIDGQEVDFAQDWGRVTFAELLQQYVDLDMSHLNQLTPSEARKLLLRSIGDLSLDEEGKSSLLERASFGTLLDFVYKHMVRPHVRKPTWIFDYPASMMPLAQRKRSDPNIANSAQVVVGGAEILKAYQENTDPVVQYEAFLDQMHAKVGGDEEAMTMDLNFIQTLMRGLPPCVGYGLGVDRLLSMIVCQGDIRRLRKIQMRNPL